MTLGTNDTQNNNALHYADCHAEGRVLFMVMRCHYAEYCHVVCRGAFPLDSAFKGENLLGLVDLLFNASALL
jgi:hypothetical protein